MSSEKYLCATCFLDLPVTNYHEDGENPLWQKLSYITQLDTAVANLHFENQGIAQKLLHKLKYSSNPELGVFLGRNYGQTIKSQIECDMILPVPIHWKKRKKRGFNQSDFIAQGIGEMLGVPTYPEVLVKRKDTESQTKKNRILRHSDMSNAFRVLKPRLLVGQRVLLVDDVITTGATVSALAEELIKFDVESISICSLATGIK